MTVAQAPTNTDNNLTWSIISRILNNKLIGTLIITMKGESREFGSGGLQAEVRIHNPNFLKRMVTGGSMAAAEGFIKGDWDSPDLTAVTRLFARNLNHASGKPSLINWLQRVKHWAQRNTLIGSKKNIAAHYDLGNDLFESFLDKSMMYSSAIYPNKDASLEDAQEFRLNRICQKLHLSPNNHLLEIGTGWGSLAIHAAKNFGCKVTTTTISEEQFDHVSQRIRNEGLEDKVTLLKEDYRNLEGSYDRLVSIEMIEAVGHEFLTGYFQKIDSLLVDDGIALIQSITIPDQRYDSYTKSVDFIRKYIFPGGHLPSISMIHQQIADATNMVAAHFEDITEHYAQTLADWHDRFMANYHTLPQDKYDQEFYRLWRFYFAYCEGGFRERAIGTNQLVFVKPAAKPTWSTLNTPRS
jgi:cyclopropane-fatty-acyl-phospholipid synthase